MTLETVKELFAYNRWANEQVLACVASAPDNVFKAAHDYSVGSIHEQIFHMMQSDYGMLMSLTGGDYSQSPKIEDYPTLAAIKAKFSEIESAYEDCLNSLDSLDGRVTIPMENPLEMSLPDFLMSGFNHGTNHRAQILALLHKHGQKTCEQGYFFYVMAHEKAATA